MEIRMLRKIVILFSMMTLYATKPPFLEQSSKWAQQTIESMTLEQKIGQLFIVAAASNDEQPNESLASAFINSPYNMDPEHVIQLIKEYHVGGVIFLFKSDPERQNALLTQFKEIASIPLLIAQDCEWGLSMRLDNDPSKVVRYPRNMTLGAIANQNLIYRLGNEIGKQCAALGIHLNLAPVADVNNNPKNPVIHDRSFGDDPQRVAQLAALFAQGLQDAGILACAKHFPGHGDTAVDSHLSLPVIPHDKKRLEEVELPPFKQLINKGISAVMTGHLSVPAFDDTVHQSATMSSALINQQLKAVLGFKGLVITDGLGMQAITDHYKPGEIELKALRAGNDILLCPVDVPQAFKHILNAVHNGAITESDINQRVLKILQAKEWVLNQHSQDITDALSYIVRPQAYALQKKLFRKAITVTNHKLIPLQESPDSTTLIQIGTLPEGSFIKQCTHYGRSVFATSHSLSEDNELENCLLQASNADVAVLSIGQMNKFVDKNYGIASNVQLLINKLKDAHKKVAVILFGTPYSINVLDNVDEFMVVYEDASPAQEAAVDILFGNKKAQGILPITLNK